MWTGRFDGVVTSVVVVVVGLFVVACLRFCFRGVVGNVLLFCGPWPVVVFVVAG